MKIETEEIFVLTKAKVGGTKNWRKQSKLLSIRRSGSTRSREETNRGNRGSMLWLGGVKKLHFCLDHNSNTRSIRSKTINANNKIVKEWSKFTVKLTIQNRVAKEVGPTQGVQDYTCEMSRM